MSKILVAYFSAEGTTAAKAKKLCEAADAELYEIKPEKPYSSSDINWRNPVSRCNREWLKKQRPELSDKNAPVADSDVVFLCFPIWYYNAPLIIRSFLEAYDFSGKKIVLFATSGGSEFGKTAETLKQSAPNSEICEGAMLNGSVSDEFLKEIAEKY
ncbi:MAG: NAD(P)H-dependent oxidoreductase [Clostridia bacterium]|nr:NAD(P)H-dependent oxidoreductase [Clostridia bacterium]